MEDEIIETVEDGYPTEEEYNEVFGVQSDSEESEGEEVQGDGGGAESPTEEQETPPEAERQEMSQEERHRQAAMRRQREEQIRQQAEQARVDGVYRQFFAGQTNPFTGKPIQTEADYRDYERRLHQREQEAKLQSAGLDSGIIREAVSQELGPIKQQLQRQQLSAIRARAREVNQRAEASIKESLQRMAAELPGTKLESLEDVAAMPTGKAFGEYVAKGYSLEDAFYLANRQEISNQNIKAARAAARNGMANRQHLSPINPNGGDSRLELTAEQIREYREWNPGATMDEIRKAYEAEL